MKNSKIYFTLFCKSERKKESRMIIILFLDIHVYSTYI